MMRVSDFAHQQPAASMQRWAWTHFAAPLPAYPPQPLTTRVDLFVGTVDTLTKEICSAWTRPLLMSPRRCFEPVHRDADGAAVPATLTRLAQACWIGSAITATVVGVGACIVGVTLGTLAGAVRAILVSPNASRALAFYVLSEEDWADREDTLRGAFVRQMSHQRVQLPVVLKAAVSEHGSSTQEGMRAVFTRLEAELRRLPDVVEPKNAGRFLATVGDIVEALHAPEQDAMPSHVALDAEGRQYTNAQHQHAAEILTSLRELIYLHKDASGERRRAMHMLQSI